mgnify:FL=1
MGSHTLRGVQELLGLSRSAIVQLVKLGFVKPERGARRAYEFSFQDVVLLRTAHELRSASIPTAKILRALRRLKDELPADAPLSGLRITAVGNDIVVRNRDSQWAADTGQLLMDFDVGVQTQRGSEAVIRPLEAARKAVPVAHGSPDELFAQAQALEDIDIAAAKRIYAKAIATAPGFTNAYLNLGALLCESGDCDDAVRLFTKAIEHQPLEALLYFNRAVALEDLKRFGEALESYDLALQLDPELADAHFNAGRLHDELGHQQRAIRHYSAYRRLSK